MGGNWASNVVVCRRNDGKCPTDHCTLAEPYLAQRM
jgi:hypothetical protein